MKLYFSPGACSLSPHIVLKEAGLAFEAIAAPTKTHKLADGTDYYSINPLGYVPFLVLDDGRTLHEGPAIVQYIADQVPAKQLAPANGSWERYKSLADIERGFRVLKSEIEIGPIYHRLPDRIHAHASICFMALILYRVMRSRLKDSNTKISPERALEKLRRIQHQVVTVNDLEPIAGLSSINQEHAEILQALTIKKPTLPVQLTLL